MRNDTKHRLERIESALTTATGSGDHVSISELLHRIEAALVVRDPGNARSTDAYEGLRRQVVRGSRERHQHLVQLIRFREAIDRGYGVDELSDLVDGWIQEAGLLSTTDDESTPELFEATPDDVLDWEQTAWFERSEDALIPIRLGRVSTAKAAVEHSQTEPTVESESAAPGDEAQHQSEGN